ncbi:MarR family winged helix-turn-helix transcriptional regulator [Comamonas composti]|uniref:MarR family winged helix-turn-helix transcriptional regulator n=1 Tax=Comamonas composti TaxID=408558 RepID=UPI000685E80B|nr:MarR family transcriptional regulator [Comamonas composti]
MPQSRSHPWRQPCELNDLFLYQLARLVRSTGSMVVRLCEGGFGITRREWLMLALLADKGAMQPSQLADLAQLDRTRTSRTISALRAKGLVQKQGIAGDRRQALLSLTAEGRALHAALFPQIQRINQELLGDVSDAELELLSQLFARIRERGRAMQQQGDFPKAERRRGRMPLRDGRLKGMPHSEGGA